MIEIKITADTAREALQDLTKLAATLTATATPAPKAELTPPPKREKPKAEPTPPPTETPTAETSTDTAKTAEDTAGQSGKAETAKPKKLTIEDVRPIGVAAAEKHGKDAVKALLTDLGVAGMTQLTDEQLPVFLERLGELDA